MFVVIGIDALVFYKSLFMSVCSIFLKIIRTRFFLEFQTVLVFKFLLDSLSFQ
ncbi:hypothetical protein KsCSTR_40400 [Candidatus Kuenenia stuttgartiensis]|uniref:Uncharacterized protein n=1 Tax=Kuenenia stuttgartiensis TaxID=174633 RepID=Q1Q7M6_KUEST|nr:hypothetical protein KsCSTR_40400 [Candidatus Kuenenia stuttgartiensis]CAJ70831.1 unknown protein [Candidatus Kuenenia stuttgartiensis]